MRCLELFCGIGGFAAACPPQFTIVQAIDVSQPCLEVYRLNHAHPTTCRTLDTITSRELQDFDADFWWMSPPCQPFTRRGVCRDLDDRRCRALLNLIERIEDVKPDAIGLENVPPFEKSQAYGRLRNVLASRGYACWTQSICPTQLGIPNRRQRFYLLATRYRAGLRDVCIPDNIRIRPLASFAASEGSDLVVDPALYLSDDIRNQYAHALDLVALDSRKPTACFTSAYGRSIVRSGSYLETSQGLRRFSPNEVAALLGFPTGVVFPKSLALQKKWSLLGNSVSVDVIRWILNEHFG